MNVSTQNLCEALRKAGKPEDLFGDLPSQEDGLRALKKVFREFVLQIHPDRVPDLKDSGYFLDRLQALRAEAETLLKDGSYGKPRKKKFEAKIRSSRDLYQTEELIAEGEVSNVFFGKNSAGKNVVLKVVRAPSDNDLLENEGKVLEALSRPQDEKSVFFQKYLPRFVESFSTFDSSKRRVVNVFERSRGFYSLAEVRQAYPEGLDTRDVAWMLRRILEVTGYVHDLRYVHGAISPDHVLIHPERHTMRLVGWSYAVPEGKRLLAVSAKYRSDYPDYVFQKKPVKGSLDVRGAAQTASLLLRDRNGELRKDVPASFRGFLDSCIQEKIPSGWDAYRRYDEILRKEFGERKFRVFSMPPRT